MSHSDPLEAWRQNPFFVLELETSATRVEVERAGQKLLALLAVKNEAARHCTTPLGPIVRDEDSVRKALAALRDPNARVVHELWAKLTFDAPAPDAIGEPGWDEAPAAIGFLGAWPTR